MKKCSKCGKLISLSGFSKNKKGKDGYRSVCKKCNASDRMLYRAREKFLKIEKSFPGCITKDSYDKRIDDLYCTVQIDNISNGYCGINANNRNAKEVDHIVPLSKGGLHVFSNLQVLTVGENRSKKNTQKELK